MLPPGLESRLVRTWVVEAADALPDDLRPLVDESGKIGDASLQRHGPRRGRTAWLEQLRRSGAIRAEWSLRPPEVSARRVRVVRALRSDAEPPRRAPVQRAILEALGDGESTMPDLAEALEMDPASLLAPARRLEALGRVELGWRTVERDPLAHRAQGMPLRNELAPEQRAALDAIGALAPGGELLLEGVAASGKTDVYLAAIQETLDAGGAAIVLVPEVSLIPQIADRLRSALGDQLAVLHSGLSAGERHDEWWRILRGDARVVIGTRTAAFAPLEPSLIVVDEEHDGGIQVRPNAALRRALGLPAPRRAGRRAAGPRDRDARPRDPGQRPSAAMPSGRGSSSAGSAGYRRSRSSTSGPSSPAGIGRSSRPT